MKMSDVKVGMKLRSIISDYEATYWPITVTEIIPNGFKYIHAKRSMKIGYSNGIPEFGICEGGEHFGVNGECLYEEIDQTDYEI